MPARPPITIIGIGLGPDDLSGRALRAIGAARVLIGGRRLLGLFPDHGAEKIAIGRDAAALVGRLPARLRGKKAIVVLASGDPNFYGIAALFYRHFPPAALAVIPNITAFQAAFARVKQPWDRACFVSVHGRSLRELDRIVRSPGLYVVYCDGAATPAAAAAYLIDRDATLGRCRAWVCDSLGSAAERVTAGTLRKMLKVAATPLSLMILDSAGLRQEYGAGIPDSLFDHDRGMITRRDIRLLTLARLEPADGLVLWDIGAGTGSVAIEACRACPGLQAFAIERDPRRFRQLRANIGRLRAPGVAAVAGSAPEACKGLPRPDRVFIGGSGGALEAILNTVKRQLGAKGVVVANCVTVDTLDTVVRRFKAWRWQYDVTSVNISRLSGSRRPEIFRAENPVYIVQGRPGRGS